MKDIGKAGARDRAASLGVLLLLLLGTGAVLVEADSLVFRLVWACNRDGLGLDPGVEQEELVRVALHGARVDGDPGGILVADDAQLQLVPVAGVDSCGVCCERMAVVCASIMMGPFLMHVYPFKESRSYVTCGSSRL